MISWLWGSSPTEIAFFVPGPPLPVGAKDQHDYVDHIIHAYREAAEKQTRWPAGKLSRDLPIALDAAFIFASRGKAGQLMVANPYHTALIKLVNDALKNPGGPLHDDAQISVGSRIKYHHRHVNGVAIRLRTIESKTAPQPLRSFLSHIAAMTREPMVVNAPQANGTTPPRLVFFAEAPPVSGLGGAQGALFREAIVNAFQEAASRLTAEALTNVQAWRLAAAFVFQDHARAGQLVLDKPDHDNLAAALGDSLKKNGVFEFHRSRISMAEEMKIYGTRAGVLVVMEPLDGQNLDKTKPIDWPALLAKFQAIAAPSDVAAPRVPRMAAPPAVQLFQPKAA